MQYYHIMFRNIGPPSGSGWITDVNELGNWSTVSGHDDTGGI